MGAVNSESSSAWALSYKLQSTASSSDHIGKLAFEFPWVSRPREPGQKHETMGLPVKAYVQKPYLS